ncbi:hypothetical protein AMECASPLE_010921 [Ameca splendens]|uniref:Uncharacterized protein n=1 Tax=Ameca splendens TaxID=208324 RepID=A0ABV0XDP9_9TELE
MSLIDVLMLFCSRTYPTVSEIHQIKKSRLLFTHLNQCNVFETPSGIRQGSKSFAEFDQGKEQHEAERRRMAYSSCTRHDRSLVRDINSQTVQTAAFISVDKV